MKLSFMCTILLVTLNGWVYSEDRCIYVMDTINRIIDGCYLTNPANACGTGWVLFRNHCYYFVEDTEIDFQGASDGCHSIGSFLVKIENLREGRWITSRNYAVSGNHFWVGATRLPDNHWYWELDNSSIIGHFWDFGHSQPSNMAGENCIGIYLPTSKWYDHQCDASLDGYICERAG